jgi:hypothetical protein
MVSRITMDRRNAYWVMLALDSLTCQYGAMDICNHRVGIRNSNLGTGHCNLGICDLCVGVCDHNVGGNHQFRLKTGLLAIAGKNCDEHTVKM